jgi:hypothetical protein
VTIDIYIGSVIAIAAIGFLAGRWLLVAVAFVLWITVLALAGVAGAYHPTTEDTSGTRVLMAGGVSMPWVVACMLGTAARRAIRWIASPSRHWRKAPVAG